MYLLFILLFCIFFISVFFTLLLNIQYCRCFKHPLTKCITEVEVACTCPQLPYTENLDKPTFIQIKFFFFVIYSLYIWSVDAMCCNTKSIYILKMHRKILLRPLTFIGSFAQNVCSSFYLFFFSFYIFSWLV